MGGENAPSFALNQKRIVATSVANGRALPTIKAKDGWEKIARRFCPSFSRELQSSVARNDVCNAARGLSNFVPPNPIPKSRCPRGGRPSVSSQADSACRSEEHTSELQSRFGI